MGRNEIRSFVGVCVVLLSLATFSPAQTRIIQAPKPSTFGVGKKMQFKFTMTAPKNLALSIRFREASFTGATILPRFNGQALLPYHAFGGDTRYDSVKGKPGMHPPLAKLEANYVLPKQWLQTGDNYIAFTNAGPGTAVLESVIIRDAAGHDLPRYENPIYFDFDVWRQGLTVTTGTSWYLDSMFLGITPGSGNFVMNYSGGDGLPLKMGAEEARIGWGFKHSHFYAIWHLVNNAKDWVNYIDVDNNKETTARIHTQFADPASVPKGADIALIDSEKIFNVLKPGIDGLLPYSTYYNITCEQWGPRGQGFTARDPNREDRLDEKWKAQGYGFDKWADNYREAFSKLGNYIHQKNPGAPILSTHWWAPDIRLGLYDTAVEAKQPLNNMIDAMMSHYYSTPYVDFDTKGKPTIDNVNPERQYPGGQFDKTSEFWKWRQYMGTWLQIPEFAIDYNRYRLGRTEKDILPAVKEKDPKAGYWANGKPIRHTAGFDGDECSYNNETAIYDRNYNGPSAYQFLYSHFNYSLLPTSAHEPKEFKVTRTLPLDPEAKATDDIFSEVDIPINRYGDWELGAAHTHRLRTRDPLYGDLFGYTGFEYANSGDYIWLSGVKERFHNREPYNTQNLIRRMCYAFVTSGEVFPAVANDPDTNEMVVKSLVVKQDWKDIVGLYAVNFDDKPHTLDVTLPVGWNVPVTAQVFDDKALAWQDAREVTLTPVNGGIRYKVTVPAKSPWVVFIYPPAARTFDALGGPPTPQPLGPWSNANVAADVQLRWKPATPTANYQVQVGREMLFRAADIVLDRSVKKAAQLAVTEKLEPNRRYHWRVRAVNASGESSGWSRPHSFWYQAATPGAQPTGDAPPLEMSIPRAKPQPELKPFTDADNLAHTGHPFAFGNYWEGAGEAVDGNPESFWVAHGSDYNARKTTLPAWWAVRFDTEQTVSEASIMWNAKMHAKDFEIQTWDGKAWVAQQTVKDNTKSLSQVKFAAPVKTRAVRIYITAMADVDIGIAEIYLR